MLRDLPLTSQIEQDTMTHLIPAAPFRVDFRVSDGEGRRNATLGDLHDGGRQTLSRLLSQVVPLRNPV